MTSLMIALFIVALIIILYNATENFYAYNKAVEQNNNYKADNHYRKAVIYSILCIVFIIAFACNREEFHLSNNHLNKCPMSEQINATSPDHQVSPWAVKEHGSTVARVNSTNLAGILPFSLLLLFKKQIVRVKAIRLQTENNKHITVITRTYVIKSMPTIEQYLS